MKTGVGQFVLLPLTIITAMIVLGTRADDVWDSVASGRAFDLVAPSLAEGTADSTPSPSAANADASASTQASPQAGPSAGQSGSADAQKSTDKQAPADSTAAPAAAAGDKADSSQRSDTGIQTDMSAPEIEILQQLSKRRQELDARAKDLDQKEALLEATEQRINTKVADMQKLRVQLDEMIKSMKQTQDAQLESMVKIYETMKPADAAKIFETLDMPVLTELFRQMKEVKSAPILAAMDPAKARTITDALINHKEVPDIGAATTP